MLQVTTRLSEPLNKANVIVEKVNQSIPAFKGNLDQDVFVKTCSTKKCSPSFNGLMDYFTVPKVLRKKPDLKALALEAINGDTASYNKLKDSPDLKDKDMEKVNNFIFDKITVKMADNVTIKQADVLVNMGKAADMALGLIKNEGRLKDLYELPVKLQGMGWVSAIRECDRVITTSTNVLDLVVKYANPSRDIAISEMKSAIKDYLIQDDPDIKRNNIMTYGKVAAVKFATEFFKPQLAIEMLIYALKENNVPAKAKAKAAEEIPYQLIDLKADSVEKAEIESNVVSLLKEVIKLTKDKDLQLACYKAIDEINK
ncbi:MAG: hypothetical protein AB1782_03195 [Cyanobacteriota bacterium]